MLVKCDHVKSNSNLLQLLSDQSHQIINYHVGKYVQNLLHVDLTLAVTAESHPPSASTNLLNNRI